MVAADWDNMVSKHHELIVNMLKRSSINASYCDTDLVTDVLWNHNIWARFQYSAQMCIQSMQAKMSMLENIICWWSDMIQMRAHHQCFIWLDTTSPAQTHTRGRTLKREMLRVWARHSNIDSKSSIRNRISNRTPEATAAASATVKVHKSQQQQQQQTRICGLVVVLERWWCWPQWSWWPGPVS